MFAHGVGLAHCSLNNEIQSTVFALWQWEEIYVDCIHYTIGSVFNLSDENSNVNSSEYECDDNTLS